MGKKTTEVKRPGEIYNRFFASLLDEYDTCHPTTTRAQVSLSPLHFDCVNKLTANVNYCVNFSSCTAKGGSHTCLKVETQLQRNN